jgi:hypothetical protein
VGTAAIGNVILRLPMWFQRELYGRMQWLRADLLLIPHSFAKLLPVTMLISGMNSSEAMTSN